MALRTPRVACLIAGICLAVVTTGCDKKPAESAAVPVATANTAPPASPQPQEAPQPVGPAEQLALRALPPIEDIRLQNGVVNYSDAAKAWWITRQCKFTEPELYRDFEHRLADFTFLMDTLFQAEFQISREQANQYSQKIQMYALQDMSANQFYGCGDKARELWLTGYHKTRRVTENIVITPAPQGNYR